MNQSSQAIEDAESFVENDTPSRSNVLSRQFLTGLERSLPSLHQLLYEYQVAIEEKARYKTELEHQTCVMNDLQLELDHYQKSIGCLSRIDDLQKKLDELGQIEVTHKELKHETEMLEEKLNSLDKDTETAIALIKESASQEMSDLKQNFLSELKRLEDTFNEKMNQIREEKRNKAIAIKATKQKMEVEHAKRKEELRKAATNKLKSASHHIECRSIELDLKRQLSYLEKELKQLEQHTSKRKLPLTFTNKNKERVSPQRPTQPLHPQTPKQSKTGTPQNQSRNSARKRKLYSVNSDFLDF